MALALLLHDIQHIAYAYSLDHIISPVSFLEGVANASPMRRFLVLIICGMIAALGWSGLYRYGKPLVSIAQSIKTLDKMPFIETVINALLQIITVALGSPLGREVAPREIGALFAGWLGRLANLPPERLRILIACGAGGGLAAVYNVPIGGTLFVLEGLLKTWDWRILLPALATATIAVLVSWWGLGNVPQYDLSGLSVNASIICWSIVVSPLFGVAGYWYARIANNARAAAPQNGRLIVYCMLNFIAIGILAIYFPALLGNGKSAIRVEFNAAANLGLSFILLLFRVLTTWSSFRAGAVGGILTPSMANGALLGGFLGCLWSLFWPASPPGAFALVGAAAFLAAGQRLPITAIILCFEFTRIDFGFTIPITMAVCGAVALCHLCIRWEERPK